MIAITIYYNLLGLISILGVYEQDPLYSSILNRGTIGIIVIISTFPITAFSYCTIRFFTLDLYPVFIIQFIMLLISIYIVDLIARRMGKNK
jgi:hypothetical protein